MITQALKRCCVIRCRFEGVIVAATLHFCQKHDPAKRSAPLPNWMFRCVRCDRLRREGNSTQCWNCNSKQVTLGRPLKRIGSSSAMYTAVDAAGEQYQFHASHNTTIDKLKTIAWVKFGVTMVDIVAEVRSHDSDEESEDDALSH